MKNRNWMSLLVPSVLAFSCSMSLHANPLEDLHQLQLNKATVLSNVPLDQGRSADFKLWRVEVYSPEAKIWLDTANGMIELPRSERIFYRGYALDDSSKARIALSTDASGQDLDATIYTPNASYTLAWRDEQWQLSDDKMLIPAGQSPTFQCGNTPNVSLASEAKPADALKLGSEYTQQSALSSTLAPPDPKAVLATRTATIAFDVDASALANKFASSNANVTNYLPNLINTMNTSYDAPLNVQLLQGTVFIRTAGSDPYSGLNTTNALLDRVGAQWRDNHAGVQRAFVMLISASQGGNGCSAAGLAWVDAYCQNGTPGPTNVYGSYSANQLFFGACGSIPISNDNRITAHELGHNFGASHTHCTSNGGGGFIDQCFSGESGSCYNGAQSCPGTGGTLMSYCHLLSGCSTSFLFHPTHISIITPKTNTAFTNGCLKPASSGTELIFASGFE